MKIANQQSESDEPLSTCGNGERGNRTLLHSPGCHSCRIADFPIGGRSSALVPLVLAAILGVFLMSFSGSAQQNFFNFSVQYGGIRFKFQTNADQYYVLEDSQDLRNFTSDMIALGKFGPLFEVPATNSQQFFQAESISIYSPQSTLNDGQGASFLACKRLSIGGLAFCAGQPVEKFLRCGACKRTKGDSDGPRRTNKRFYWG
jgi:hypothetical protein